MFFIGFFHDILIPMANQIIALNQIAMSSGASRRRKKQQVTLKGNCTFLAHLSQMSWNRYHVHKPDPKSSIFFVRHQ